MPREGLHWLILSQSLEECERTQLLPEVISVCRQNLSYAQLGAVIHDAPYFLDLGKENPFQAVSEVLHGKNGEDTLEPLRTLGNKVREVQGSARNPLIAFLLGMFSHCIVDWTFHPLIFYFTGHYYDKDTHKRFKARTRHRLFEVYLDSYFVRKPIRLSSIVSQCTEHLGSITNFLTNIAKDFPDAQELWTKSINDFAFSQTLMLSGAAGFGIRCIKKLGLKNIEPLDALTRFGRSKAPEYFSEVFSYKNPVSGTPHRHTLDELKTNAIQECVLRFDAWGKFFLGQTEAPQEVGKSLSFGIENVSVPQAKYFSETLDV